ncbi:hypothetical protein MKW98_031700 [Papaver atlanticum]|uniref:Uncharacterized protein n=1 Tax=Papaver atlanticum TaxID=357466 RepID=A0AAD4S6C3_9MAGN|nr:hypothetical protein MKW98_031700 [Papaver atlanticum]
MGRYPPPPRDDENNNGIKKGPWTPEEDQKLVSHIQLHGHGCWRTLPKLAGLNRCGKSCRLRWTNYLSPDIKKGKNSQEEEDIILNLHSILGNKWSAIAKQGHGGSDSALLNQGDERKPKVSQGCLSSSFPDDQTPPIPTVAHNNGRSSSSSLGESSDAWDTSTTASATTTNTIYGGEVPSLWPELFSVEDLSFYP